jgi:hypothetical protein
MLLGLRIRCSSTSGTGRRGGGTGVGACVCSGQVGRDISFTGLFKRLETERVFGCGGGGSNGVFGSGLVSIGGKGCNTGVGAGIDIAEGTAVFIAGLTL